MANFFLNSVKFITAVSLLSSEQGTTIKELGERLGISRRSVFRLLKTLEELGLPLVDEPSPEGTGKVYRILEPQPSPNRGEGSPLDSFVLKLPNMALPNLGLTENELAVINSILCFLAGLQEDATPATLKSISEKLSVLDNKKRLP